MRYRKFKLISQVSMVEIHMVAYVKEEKLHQLNGVTRTNTKPCGQFGPVKFGNKGGV